MKKYRVGRKQKRVILDENSHEVLIVNRKHTHLTELICKSLNDIFLNGDTEKRESKSICHCATPNFKKNIAGETICFKCGNPAN